MTRKGNSALESFLCKTSNPTPAISSKFLRRSSLGTCSSAVSCNTQQRHSTCSTTVTTAEQSAKPPLPDAELDRLSAKAHKNVLKKFRASPHFEFASKRLEFFPKFTLDELHQGLILGKGQFGIVSEVRSVILSKHINANLTPIEIEDREFIRNYCQRDNPRHRNCNLSDSCSDWSDDEEEPKFIAPKPKRRNSLTSKTTALSSARYAIKLLNTKHFCEDIDFYNCARDMAIEAHFLAAMEHKHIIKLRALSVEPLGGKTFFLVLDRLYGTLKDKLIEWRTTHKKFHRRSSSITNKIMSKSAAILREKKRDFLQKRMSYLKDLTSAVTYLHTSKIIQRDLKPDNVGFDIRGELKLFDFGLSTEVPNEATSTHSSGVSFYKMSGRTGSLRYMAPEVFSHLPYNESIDIYALGIISWQMLSLEKLYPNMDREAISEQVMGKGHRPELPKPHQSSWCTPQLEHLLQHMWHVDPLERPTAKHVQLKLARELSALKAKKVVEDDSDEPGSIEGTFNCGRGGLFMHKCDSDHALTKRSSTFKQRRYTQDEQNDNKINPDEDEAYMNSKTIPPSYKF